VSSLSQPVAADGHLQKSGPPPERLAGQPPDHRVVLAAQAAAPVTPSIALDDPAGRHRTPS
jgi:hypothetical protein